MPPLLRIFFTGWFISFLGSLPLGSLNIAAMQIGISIGIAAALIFSLGSLTAEVVYVRLSLVAMDWIRKQQRILKMLEWLTFLIVAALAVASFYTALHPSVTKNPILTSTLHPFLLGLFMSALNPVQIPFWFGWSTVLFTRGILKPRSSHYNIYIAGIGLGTLAGNCVFIFGGKLIADSISENQNILNWIIGGIFALTALIQLWKILRHKDVQHQLEHPEALTKKFEEQLPRIDTEKNQMYMLNQSLLPEFKQEMAQTRKMLERVPFEQVDWRPHPKSMKLGRLAAHVAETPLWASIILGGNEVNFATYNYTPLAAASNEDLLQHFDANVSEVTKALEEATDEQLMQPWSLRNGEHVYFTIPRIAAIRTLAMNHLLHHRGQLSVFLRLLDVPVPGMYGPSADEAMKS